VKEKITLSTAVGRIAWGYVFLHFNLNINTFDLVPDWVCYALILSVLPVLGEVQRSILLLRTMTIGLCIWKTVTWINPLFQGFLELLASVISLYYHFQLLTDLAAIGEKMGYPDTKKLLNLRTGRTLIATGVSLPLNISLEGIWSMIPLAAMSIIMIWTLVVLFSLGDYLRKIQISED